MTLGLGSKLNILQCSPLDRLPPPEPEPVTDEPERGPWVASRFNAQAPPRRRPSPPHRARSTLTIVEPPLPAPVPRPIGFCEPSASVTGEASRAWRPLPVGSAQR